MSHDINHVGGVRPSLVAKMSAPVPVCDSCGYRAAPLNTVDAIHDSLGMTCPMCGTVMITKDDYEKMQCLLRITGGITDNEDMKLSHDGDTDIIMKTTINSKDLDVSSPRLF